MRIQKLLHYFILTLIAFLPGWLMAQEVQVSNQNYFKRNLPGLNIGGYFRGFLYMREMKQPYGTIGKDKLIAINDPIYYDPMLFMYIGGSPSEKTRFDLELNMVNPMTGPSAEIQSYLNVFQRVALNGYLDFGYKGKYAITLGGIEWTSISPFTFGGNVKYNRYSIFERRPWDPGGDVKSRYSAYYSAGTIQQDVRFGTAAFKGLLVRATELPYKLSFDLFYGKAASNGGYDRQAQVMPKYNWAAKINKEVKNVGTISVNGFSSVEFTDSINAGNAEKAMFRMITVMGNVRIKKLKLLTEVGYGGYLSPVFPEANDPAIVTDLLIPKEYSKVPVSLKFYSIGKNFVNRNASFSNTTIKELNQGFGGGQGASVMLPVGTQFMEVGDLANNRIGGNINTEIKLGRLKVQLGNEVAADKEKISGNTQIGYMHRINTLAWSRFAQFPNPYGNFGPNQHVNSVYRAVYETATISEIDTAGDPLFKYHYNAADVQAKLKFRIFKKDLLIFNLNSFGSIQNIFSPIPLLNSKSYIHARYHELEFYYALSNSIMLDLYLGIERIQGNNKTDEYIDAAGTSHYRDQTGKGLGLGLDYRINGNTNVYIRHRQFDYKDKSIATEKFRGHETVVELKIFY